MGKTFLIYGALSGFILHHCDKFIKINWIKCGGSFEDISLIIKLYFVSRENYMSLVPIVKAHRLIPPIFIKYHLCPRAFKYSGGLQIFRL